MIFTDEEVLAMLLADERKKKAKLDRQLYASDFDKAITDRKIAVLARWHAKSQFEVKSVPVSIQIPSTATLKAASAAFAKGFARARAKHAPKRKK